MFSIYFLFSKHILWCYLLFISFILYVHVPYVPFTECFWMPGSSKYFLYSCELNKFEFSISPIPPRPQRSMNGFGWTFSELELHTRIGSAIVIFVRYLSSFLNTPELKKKKIFFWKSEERIKIFGFWNLHCFYTDLEYRKKLKTILVMMDLWYSHCELLIIIIFDFSQIKVAKLTLSSW